MPKLPTLRNELAEGRNPLALGRVCALTQRFRAQPQKAAQLIQFLWDNDEGVSSRAADILERISRTSCPALDRIFSEYKKAFLGLLPEAKPKKLRWNLALMLGRLPLTPSEARRATAVLESWLNDKSSIVKTAALQGIADLTMCDPAMLPGAVDLLRIQGRSGTPAMRARSRILLKRLEYTHKSELLLNKSELY
ncbi:MAG: hypothetical protein WBQ94_29840 [Terracidiphilus sp.]